MGALTTWASLTAGAGHLCGIRADGSLWCWGENNGGRLGVGDNADRTSPTQVGGATSWKTVTAGNLFTCGTRTGRTVWCWGLNDRGQLGLGDTANRTTPAQVPSFRARPLGGGRGAGAVLAIG